MAVEHPDGEKQDPGPKLIREVELPRPRSGGAAAVLVATMAMFTAIGASAFVVRARTTRGRACPHTRTPQPRAVAPRLDGHEAALMDQFWDARNRGDQETALDVFQHLSADRRLLLGPTRDELARAYQDEQLALIDTAVEELRCEDAEDRLRRLRRLVPEAKLPIAMDACRGR